MELAMLLKFSTMSDFPYNGSSWGAIKRARIPRESRAPRYNTAQYQAGHGRGSYAPEWSKLTGQDRCWCHTGREVLRCMDILGQEVEHSKSAEIDVARLRMVERDLLSLHGQLIANGSSSKLQPLWYVAWS